MMPTWDSISVIHFRRYQKLPLSKNCFFRLSKNISKNVLPHASLSYFKHRAKRFGLIPKLLLLKSKKYADHAAGFAIPIFICSKILTKIRVTASCLSSFLLNSKANSISPVMRGFSCAAVVMLSSKGRINVTSLAEILEGSGSVLSLAALIISQESHKNKYGLRTTKLLQLIIKIWLENWTWNRLTPNRLKIRNSKF